MLKENPKNIGQEDLYRARLESIIDLGHELVKMMRLVEWDGLASDLAPFCCATNGRPGEPIRLMAGLQLLKDMKGLSDEEVCEVWRENPCFQYFCGEEFFSAPIAGGTAVAQHLPQADRQRRYGAVVAGDNPCGAKEWRSDSP